MFQHTLWDNVNTDLASNEDYSPRVPGKYTWPFEGATDYNSTIVAGPLPPAECADSAPAGTALIGCYTDSSTHRLLNSDSRALNKRVRVA